MPQIVLISIGTGIVIYFCNVLKIPKAISISVVLFVSIVVDSGAGDVLAQTTNRIVDTTIGVFIAVLVNVVISPRNFCESIYKERDIFLCNSEKIFSMIDENVNFEKKLKILENSYEKLFENMEIYQSEIKLSHKRDDRVRKIESYLPILYNIMIEFRSIDKLSEEENGKYIDIDELNNTKEYHVRLANKEYLLLQQELQKQ